MRFAQSLARLVKAKLDLLILDGGGSSLKAFARDSLGLKPLAVWKGNFNALTGNRKFISQTVKRATNRFPSKKIIVGLAGLISPKEKSNFKKMLAQKLPPISFRVMSDAELAFHLRFPTGDGAVVILGTGSIFIAKVRGKFIKIGGYGRTLGDAGGGYAIGQLAARRYVELCDGFHHDEVFKSVFSKVFSNKKQALRAVYQESFDLQNLAPLVFNAAELGSPIACGIVSDAVAEVRRFVKRLQNEAGATTDLPMLLLGGLVETENFYSQSLRRALKLKS